MPTSLHHHHLHLLLLLLLTQITTAEWVKRWREFDFNTTRTNYDSLRIAPEKGKFIVKDVIHSDIDLVGRDQYVAVAGDQLLAVNGELITTMSVREILRQPTGRFMLPLVNYIEQAVVEDLDQELDGSKKKKDATASPPLPSQHYKVVKWLRLEIVEAESISYRPQMAARQAKMRRANYEVNERKSMAKTVEESKKQAESRRALDVEENEKTITRRKREEQETKHKQKMLVAAEEMDTKQKALEEAEKSRAESGFKREQQRKQSQQKSIAENQQKSTELSKQASMASAHAAQAKRNLASEDLKKLQDQKFEALKQRQDTEIGKVREKVAKENEEHRKQSEEVEKERDHQMSLAKADEESRKKLVESIRNEQEAKRLSSEMVTVKVAEEAMKSEENPYENIEVKFRHKGPLGLFFVPNVMPMTIAMNGKDNPPFNLRPGDLL